MADDTVETARRELDERLDRAFEGTTPAQITAAIDALIAAVRAEKGVERFVDGIIAAVENAPSITHDTASDMGYIALTSQRRHGLVAWSLPVQQTRGTDTVTLVLDFDNENHLVGVEVFDAAKRLPRQQGDDIDNDR
jgi:uncharacterized protein YuzE